jgi:hypothetical protein
MPEQLDPQALAGTGTESRPTGIAVGEGRQASFQLSGEVLKVGPLHAEVIGDLRWAYEQYAQGAFDCYAGQYVAIVNKTVHAAGGDLARMTEEAARKADVRPERVALFHVELGE